MTWNMKNSTCSDSGWDAKLAMEAAWGITFTNLIHDSMAEPTPNPFEPSPDPLTFDETFDETFN